MEKPCWPACERNRDPILAVIQPLLEKSTTVLEIGSGTGQHAVYFAERMPHLEWQPSDQLEYHEGITQWVAESGLANLRPVIELDVRWPEWPTEKVDAIYTANTAHIMSWPSAEKMIAGVARNLNPGGLFLIYGPFNYNGTYTSESNREFDQWLISNDPDSAIRDFEQVVAVAEEHGMRLVNDNTMPANNRLLHFTKERE